MFLWLKMGGFSRYSPLYFHVRGKDDGNLHSDTSTMSDSACLLLLRSHHAAGDLEKGLLIAGQFPLCLLGLNLRVGTRSGGFCHS